jgi:hypothetical protein
MLVQAKIWRFLSKIAKQFLNPGKMKKITLLLVVFCIVAKINNTVAQSIPKYDHVVFVLEENYAYSDIIGSSYAPTFTALSKTSYTANFSQAYAITHPSEPNYLDLFSGSNQGVTADLSGPAPTAPFNNCNLGSSLIQAGYTFIGYAEGQPSLGWTAGDVGYYYTKHCPWINWIGYNTHKDTIPLTSDVPYAYSGSYTTGPIFPDSNNYSTLPTVSWVIPNSVDDMHDGFPPTSIQNGDSWYKTNMMPLVRWAVNHNTLVITIWDEDDQLHSNNIPCLFSGPNIIPGTYSTPKFNHYDVLRTIENMYGLDSLCGASKTGTVITNIWTGIPTIQSIKNNVSVWPVPAKDELNVKITSASASKASIDLYDVTGKKIEEMPAALVPGDNNVTINTSDIVNGVYFLNIVGDKINVSKKISIGK